MPFGSLDARIRGRAGAHERLADAGFHARSGNGRARRRAPSASSTARPRIATSACVMTTTTTCSGPSAASISGRSPGRAGRAVHCPRPALTIKTSVCTPNALQPTLVVLRGGAAAFSQSGGQPERKRFCRPPGRHKFALIFSPELQVERPSHGIFPNRRPQHGLSRHFFAVEPSLLAEAPCSDWVVLNGQVSYFLPLDGTDFAGEFVRYGVGLTFGNHKDKKWWITPVAEAWAGPSSTARSRCRSAPASSACRMWRERNHRQRLFWRSFTSDRILRHLLRLWS